MPQKSLTELTLVKDFLETLGGEDVIELVKVCERKRKAFTDEDVSKKMNKKVTEVRALLNKLHFRGIACYQKTRNQKTGWYNYTWEINKNRLAELIIDQQKEQLEKLNDKKSIEEDYDSFDCGECNGRMLFEVAAEYNFICPDCGGIMDSVSSPQMQKQIEKKIKLIEEEISVLANLK